MRAFHLVWSTLGRQPVFPGESARRSVLRAFAKVGGAYIVLFAIVDDHVHMVVFIDPAALSKLLRSLTIVLANRAAYPLAPVWVRSIESRKHMETMPKYCLGQIPHHGIAGHPATAKGSCFLDLIGARRIPGMALPISAALPRYRIGELYQIVGLPAATLTPASDDAVRSLGAVRLSELVAESFAVGPSLMGNDAEIAHARRVVARLAVESGLRPRDVAHALKISHAAACRLATRKVDAADLETVRLRVALDVALRSPLDVALRTPVKVAMDPEQEAWDGVFALADQMGVDRN